MLNGETINILHISDLHVLDSSHDQEEVVKCFFERVDSMIKEGERIDLVAFSGDMAARGVYTDTVKQKIVQFFERIKSSTHLTKERIVICPGNHDANLKKLTVFSRKGLEAISDRFESNSFVEQPQAEALLQFDEFKATLKEFYGTSPYDHQLYYTRIFELEGVKVGVAVFNSAWRSRGLAENKDYGHLLVGVSQIELAHRDIASCKLKIAIMHHPTNWLSPFEQQYVYRAIASNFQLVLCGHNHSADAHSIADGHSVSLTSNAGCLYHSRDYFNGFSYIKVNISAGIDIQGNEYFHEREIFGPSERFGSNGHRNFTISEDTTILEFAKPELVEAVHSRVNCQLLSYAASSIAPKNLDSVFVEPILSTKSDLVPESIDDKRSELKPIKYHLPDLLLQESKIVLIGRREGGKTTLVNYVATNLHKFHLPKVITACVIDCGKLQKRATVARIFELATQFFGSQVAVRDIKKLANQGQILFCFDGVNSDDSACIELISEFINLYSQNRYLVTCTESVNQSIYNRSLPEQGIKTNIQSLGKPIYIHCFSRKHTKELVQKWFGSTETEDGDKIDKVSAFLRKLGVPRTPFLVSLVLWVLENIPKPNLINQAAVLEAMVDGLLGKLTESKGRSRLDARLKSLFLMDFAYDLYVKNEHRFDRVYVEKFIADYFSNKGWKESAFELLNELLH